MPDGRLDNPVLSSFYLSRDLDRKLGNLAFRQERSRDEVLREIVAAGLEKLQEADPRFASMRSPPNATPAVVAPLTAREAEG